MSNFWSVVLVPVYLIFLKLIVINGQFFDPKVNDKVYLESINREVVEQVQDSQNELIVEAKIIQQLTRNYIGAQLKQNLFKALRVLAEKELKEMKKQNVFPRQQGPPTQPEEESGNEEEEEKTTRRPSVVLPQLANLVKAIFGGNINLTSYVESASQFLPKPISNQIVGVVKLLANNPGYQYTSTVAESTTTTVIASSSSSIKPKRKPATTATTETSTKFEEYEEEPEVKVSSSTTSTNSPSSTTKGQRVRKSSTKAATTDPTTTEETTPTEPTTIEVETTTEEDEDEDEFSNPGIFAKQQQNLIPDTPARQRQIPGLDILQGLGNAIGNLLNGGQNKNKGSTTETTTEEAVESTTDTTTVKRRIRGSTSTVSTGFEETEKMEVPQKMMGFDLGNLIKGVQGGVGDLLKVIPDIFGGGAREAYKLLGSVTKLFSRLDEL